MAKYLMVQGTGSHVGKSVLVAALCRIFRRAGCAVAPFKAQNMALNSFVTASGEEIAWAQVVQSWAAGLEPEVDMNPVLLKPTGNSTSQVVLRGRPVGNIGAEGYYRGFNRSLLPVVEESLRRLSQKYEVVIIEGAGSPAEVNLKDEEIANMRVAKMVRAPVLLVADIDRGGALAAIVGTLELLEPEERDLVVGLVINKFRGNRELLSPALEFLERKTSKPVLGVIPYLEDLGLPEEDSVALEDRSPGREGPEALDIAVVRLPRISNFTDFDPIKREAGVRLRFVSGGEPLGTPDLVILPGSKNTIEDLLFLEETGKAREIAQLASQGVPVIGICGGFQMLGREVRDPEGVEARVEAARGLGLLKVATVMRPEKATYQCEAEVIGHGPLLESCRGEKIRGYEIHMGETVRHPGVPSVLRITRRGGREVLLEDGAVNETGTVFGTYLHGLFDNDGFRRALVNALRRRKGLTPISGAYRYREDVERRMDSLADAVASSLDLGILAKLVGLDRPLAP
jgi:adenosylcobyric acid synthase